MNVRIMMGHVNDLERLRDKDEAIHLAIARIRAIREDLANNLSPLPDSLDALEARLTAALRA